MRKLPDADLLGRIARYVIVTFVVMIAIGQIEVGGDIVQRTFLIILGRARAGIGAGVRTRRQGVGRPRCSNVGGRGTKKTTSDSGSDRRR